MCQCLFFCDTEYISCTFPEGFYENLHVNEITSVDLAGIKDTKLRTCKNYCLGNGTVFSGVDYSTGMCYCFNDIQTNVVLVGDFMYDAAGYPRHNSTQTKLYVRKSGNINRTIYFIF